VWPGALPPAHSLAAPQKDTRPLRDKQYQSKMRQDILVHLQKCGLDINMSKLLNIQGKDYRLIFDFLLLNIDPNYPINSEARFEDEFVPALKHLQYPYVGNIDNKWLAAVASMHSWPHLLGVLHWLTVLDMVRTT
jgi:kinetochore protein NDC80